MERVSEASEASEAGEMCHSMEDAPDLLSLLRSDV